MNIPGRGDDVIFGLKSSLSKLWVSRGISQYFPVKTREIVDISEDGDSSSSRGASETGFSGSFWAEPTCCYDSAAE